MNTVDSRRIKRDLTSAKDALHDLKHATDLERAEIAWTRVLDAVQKSWNKMEALAVSAGRPGERWLSRYRGFRRDDSLLRYMHHARNADTHSLHDVSEKLEGTISVGSADPSRDSYIECLAIGKGGRVVEAKGINIRVTQRPPRLALLPVWDSGVRFDVPHEHYNLPLRDTSPLAVGNAAVRFYQEALIALEQMLT